MARARSIGGLKIATIRGVDIRFHFSLLFLLAYVVMAASIQFQLVATQAGFAPWEIRGAPLLWGILFSIGLLLSVVLHEFGHVVVAQSMGVKVRGMTLMMLGGVSEMERIPEKRFAEFKVAVVGPLVSFGLSALLFGMRSWVPSPELSFYCYWLARVNLVLGIFNLLPAFPLDGGRALRSLLAVRRTRLRATQVAVTTARVFSFILGALGLLSFNFLLVLIAVFIHSAASSELALSVSQDMLRGIRAGELGSRTEPIPEALTLLEAAQKMIQRRESALPVETQTGEAAVIHLEDFRRIPRDAWPRTRVREAMEKVGRAVDVAEPIETHLPELAASGELPLQENGRIVGLIRYQDLRDALEFQALTREDRAA